MKAQCESEISIWFLLSKYGILGEKQKALQESFSTSQINKTNKPEKVTGNVWGKIKNIPCQF